MADREPGAYSAAILNGRHLAIGRTRAIFYFFFTILLQARYF